MLVGFTHCRQSCSLFNIYNRTTGLQNLHIIYNICVFIMLQVCDRICRPMGHVFISWDVRHHIHLIHRQHLFSIFIATPPTIINIIHTYPDNSAAARCLTRGIYFRYNNSPYKYGYSHLPEPPLFPPLKMPYIFSRATIISTIILQASYDIRFVSTLYE